MSKKLKPLDIFNSGKSDFYTEVSYPKLNGIACPKCGNEMQDVGSDVLASNPPKKQIICSNEQCKHSTYRIA